jgi:hypothetical protein
MGAMSLSPIPFSAIVEYAKINDLDEEDFYDLLYIIRLMDNKLLALENKESGNKDNKRNTDKGNRRTGS